MPHGKSNYRTSEFEPADRIAIIVPTKKKPFDVLAEGLISKNSREDKTAIELFVAGVKRLAAATIRACSDRIRIWKIAARGEDSVSRQFSHQRSGNSDCTLAVLEA